MGETCRATVFKQPRNISIICSGLNSTDTNKGRTKSLRIPRASSGHRQLTAKIWTSFGWWFIYIYLTIYRFLCIPGDAFEPFIIFVLPMHLQIQYSILLCLFILVERIIWTRKPWCDYSTRHPTVKQPFHDQLKQVLVKPVMSIIYTYVQTKIFVQIYHYTSTILVPI